MKNYYAEELAYLRELGADYAREHPAIAPLLASRSTDPDVERLLEATAFLCGLINERLDQNFPEIVQGLLDLTAPNMLRAMPSQTLVQFFPDPQVQGVQHIGPETRLDSVEVGGTRCTYTPFGAMSIYPVSSVRSTLVHKSPKEATLEVSITSPAGIGNWWPDALLFHLHAPFAEACQWLYLLSRACCGIDLEAGTVRLRPGQCQVAPAPLPPGPDHAFFPGADRLRNYFLLPEQFLFLRLTGIAPLTADRSATRVTVRFHLQAEDIPASVRPDLVRLNVTPAVNLFPHSSAPFLVRQDRHEYRLTPQKDSARQLEIYAIRKLIGIQRGQTQHIYEPWSRLRTQNTGAYAVRRARSQVSGRMEYYVSLLYGAAQSPGEGETLVSDLLCFHHSLPNQLHEGDIRVPTDTSPAMASFSNILPPSPAMPAPDETDLQWRLFSCLHANMLPLAGTEAMKEFLSLWLPVRDPDPARVTLNRQRIAAVQDFCATPGMRLVKGRPVQGQVLRLQLAGECFAGRGERFLFGLVLDEVLARFATINTWTRLEVTDKHSGDTLAWTPRLGSRRLL